MDPKRDLRTACIVALALVALTLKLAIAYNTIGTNDAVFFYGFAKVLSQHDLEWTYQHSQYFNHPPLTAYYLRGIYALTEQRWCQDIGVHFPFLLRLPGIIADFLVVLVLLRMTKMDLHIPTWALALFALSPVSLMVSGFHGNTDPVMVLLLVCAVWMSLRSRPMLAGLFFALSCQIKIVPLLLLPAFVFFWLSQGKIREFLIPAAITTAIGTILTACARDDASDKAPMRNGEGTSPSRWMAKTPSAIALALSVATTRLTMAALIGPVDKKRHNCAATIHVRYRVWSTVVSAIHTQGAATSVAIADNHR